MKTASGQATCHTKRDTREAALQYAQSLADAWRETWQERLPQGPQRSGNRKYHEYSFADKGANYRELLLTAQVPDSHPVRQQLGVQQHAQQRAALERQQKDVQDRLQSARRLLQPRREFCQQSLSRCQLQRRRHRRSAD